MGIYIYISIGKRRLSHITIKNFIHILNDSVYLLKNSSNGIELYF